MSNIIGIIFAALGLLCAILSLIIVLVKSPVIGIILFIFFSAICAYIYFKMIKPILTSKKLQRKGEIAKAIILEANDTLETVNKNPKIDFLLEVMPKNGAPFKVRVSLVVSRLEAPLLQPNSIVQVKYDPADKNKIAFLMKN